MYVFSLIFKQSEVYFFAWLVGDQRRKERGFFCFCAGSTEGELKCNVSDESFVENATTEKEADSWQKKSSMGCQ